MTLLTTGTPRALSYMTGKLSDSRIAGILYAGYPNQRFTLKLGLSKMFNYFRVRPFPTSSI